MIERWTSGEALSGAARTALGTALDRLVAGHVEVVVLESVPLGDPATGALEVPGDPAADGVS